MVIDGDLDEEKSTEGGMEERWRKRGERSEEKRGKSGRS
jgi:hypothetical protein